MTLFRAVIKINRSDDECHHTYDQIIIFCGIIFNKMKIILLLIGVSLIVALGFLIAFFWAVNDGQYEDEYTPSVRMLFEEKNRAAQDLESK